VIWRMARYVVAYAGSHVDLWRDAMKDPRGWLLMRAHMQGWWPVPLAVVGLGTILGLSFPAWLLLVVLLAVAPSGVIELGADACHGLWRVGAAWSKVPCPCCGPRDGGDDDGPGGEDGPVDDGDGPDSHGDGLNHKDLLILDLISHGLLDVPDRDGGRSR
jgi:hypothetical protein